MRSFWSCKVTLHESSDTIAKKAIASLSLRNVHEIINVGIESNLTGFLNLLGLVVDFISCTFLTQEKS